MVYVRLLGIDDYSSIMNLLKKKTRISNVDTDLWDWDKWSTYFYDYFRDTETRIIGCFENNILKAFVVQKFMKHMPAWIMVLIGQETDSAWNKEGHGLYLNSCLINATEYAESRGVFDVLYSVPIRWLNTTKRTQPTSPVWSRYNVYIEKIIHENEIPMYSLHKFICGDTPKPHSRAIKRCSLKMENRYIYLNLDDKYKL